MTPVVFYSTSSRNTERFVSRLGVETFRLASPGRPFLLITPTYGDGEVPKPVIHFLNKHHSLLAGVIASGNRNFGSRFALAGDIISYKCRVPLLHKFELAGLETDVVKVQSLLEHQWTTMH